MPDPSLNLDRITQALRLLGERVAYSQTVEILLVGGAAGMVTGVLDPGRTTIDCDVMVYAPQQAMAAVEIAADGVGRDLQLPEHWFNSHVQIRRDALPDGWETRRVLIGEHGVLKVYAAGRLDLIAMKVLAGRPQDLEDLDALQLRHGEAGFIEAHLRSLPAKGTDERDVADALVLLGSLTPGPQ